MRIIPCYTEDLPNLDEQNTPCQNQSLTYRELLSSIIYNLFISVLPQQRKDTVSLKGITSIHSLSPKQIISFTSLYRPFHCAATIQDDDNKIKEDKKARNKKHDIEKEEIKKRDERLHLKKQPLRKFF